MAETRKHNPLTSAIGEAVREQLDAVPKPVTPGDPHYDPFFNDDSADDDQPALDIEAAAMLDGSWITWTTVTDESGQD